MLQLQEDEEKEEDSVLTRYKEKVLDWSHRLGDFVKESFKFNRKKTR